ncbi:glutamine amidotransferase [Ruegeria sp. HKCCD7255]|uniref:glutamine amidotransferase n=1 Tax=Ruegeria sp. HKCCD7255 TaxID=2683004 RepID=UPI00148A0F29|nr:glutamine amidotransferase [Ruegeria sp. HKCCD7255]
MKKFLILQLRPETEASDAEFASILNRAGLDAKRAHRIRLDREDLPAGLEVMDYAGVIVGGGPGCVSDDPASKSALDTKIEGAIMGLMPQITAQDHPYMGCCYGLGILAAHLGGDVSKRQYGEPVGPSECRLTEHGAQDPLTAGLHSSFEAFVGHKEAVQSLPDGCVHLVASDPCPIQMIRWGQNVYATQFHPEADAADFEHRINIYKNYGYFPPEDAQKLIDLCHSATVTQPGEILRRFVQRYG